MAIGARVSARLQPQPGRDPHYRFMDGQTWPSLLIFAGLVLAFLFGHDNDPSQSALIIPGNKELGKFVFGLAVSSGYFIGDLIAGEAFHRRLIRLGVLVAAILTINLVVLASQGS